MSPAADSRAAWLCDEVLLVRERDPDRIVPVPANSARAGVEEGLTDLGTFLREDAAGWDAQARTRLLDHLASLGASLGLTPGFSEALRQVREVLRERHPLAGPGRGVTVKRLHRIDERSFYVRGRCWDKQTAIVALTAVTPEGERVELWDAVSRLGEGTFAGRFETAFPTRGGEGWVFEARSEGGSVEAPAAVMPDPLRTLLADVALDPAGATDLCEGHLHPALTRLGELRRETGIEEVCTVGRAPAAPTVSIVVPLLRRVDLIEHQLAQFAVDPALADCELIYVVAEPDQAELTRELATELYALYGLPLRLAALTGPGDLSLACERGAALARAARLLFLGSDVLPDRPGWLGALTAALDVDPALAAAAPKLLFADGAIDQAGLEWEQAASGELRLRARLRGMRRDLVAAEESRELEAASLACLLLDRAAFEAAGGLRGDYGLAGYEGSDLARRLAADGRGLAYVPGAELFRLEGLGAEPERLGEPYARWLHGRRWAGEPAGALA